MAATNPPKYTDSPLSLIPTPKFQTGKDDPFTIEASHMALSHNAFIRGFNSIYQQAPRVTLPADKADFSGYAVAWADCVHTHHHYEETEFFPNLDKAAGKEGLMDGAIHEHEAFQGGLQKFKKYLEDKGADWKSNELIAIMDEFKDALHSHLKAEPPAIVALAKHSTPEKPIDILGIADAAGKKQVSLPFVLNTLPVFFLNMETVEFEGGMWHGVFPPLKGLAKTVMLKGVPMWHSGRWRFVSCTPEGTAKQLAV
ncbi:iron-sulfur cluster repair protein DnrN [Triangularia verruculosa]|uniref:Iron-sulfur cluster repair protein DnrN n=1 Tax=Triangularia verruculosa TaxID=2587418 RepID=A0AAN6XPJ7_9PEZI|nr:iron-sulfur cluster repair protein DnrN [Triangularia verruculosa]